MAFVKAVKTQAKLRAAISGASGSGKTYTALRVAKGLGTKIAVADSESGSASKYADKFDFDVMDLSLNKHPQEYIKAIKEAEKAGYDVLVIDSITHAWDAVKAEVEKITVASRSGNSYAAWSKGSKLWQDLEDAILGSKIHIIVTMRAKTEYVQDRDSSGKMQVKKVGMAPEVRQGTEFAYDVVLEMTSDHYGSVTKTRCDVLDGYCEMKPSEALGESLKEWLSSGVEPVIVERREIVVNGSVVNAVDDIGEDGTGQVQVSENTNKLIKQIKSCEFEYAEFQDFLRHSKKLTANQFLVTLEDDKAVKILENWSKATQAFLTWKTEQ